MRPGTCEPSSFNLPLVQVRPTYSDRTPRDRPRSHERPARSSWRAIDHIDRCWLLGASTHGLPSERERLARGPAVGPAERGLLARSGLARVEADLAAWPGVSPVGPAEAAWRAEALERQIMLAARGAGQRGRPAQPVRLQRLSFFFFLLLFFIY
jgi:hypothetical protein